mgnify:CR=1 FL=1
MNLFHFILILLAVSCEKNTQFYKVVGTVHSVDLDTQNAIIAHDTIPNLMMPMTMPFFVPDLQELEKLSVGDSVHFELVWDEAKPFSRNFKIIGKGMVSDYDDFFDDEFSEQKVGSVIDDVSFLDLDSMDVSLSKYDGKYKFISFIFSRCPMPNLCPAVVLKNAALVTRFPEIEFITISFDYKYDTPLILNKAYSASTNSHPNWNVWSSVGKIEDIYRLIKQSGGDFWGVEQGKIGHRLASVLLGKKRELLGVWKGENWKVEEVSNAIKLIRN